MVLVKEHISDVSLTPELHRYAISANELRHLAVCRVPRALSSTIRD